MSEVLKDDAARTDVGLIISTLSLVAEGFETSRPRCGGCLDLEAVRVDTAGPFPVLQGVGYVIPIGHGRHFGIKLP